ncbi:hypothetical protein HK405_011798 [Cladochytrium tenue]|nr:hypothetical protein HK405_011798 [Cladochytrium tenue]
MSSSSTSSSSTISSEGFVLILGPSANYNKDGSIQSFNVGQKLYSHGNVPSGTINTKILSKSDLTALLNNLSTSSSSTATSSSSLSAGLSSAAVAGIAVALVAVVAVLGFVVYRRTVGPALARRRRSAARPQSQRLSVVSVLGGDDKATGRAEKAASVAGGVPVFEMGQWRVMRAEDWAALEEAAAVAAAAGYSRVDDGEAPLPPLPLSGAAAAKKAVSFSDEMDVVIPPTKDGAAAAPSFPSAVQPQMGDEEAGDDEEDAGGRSSEDGEGETEGTIAFNYALLSQLASSDESASIHSRD